MNEKLQQTYDIHVVYRSRRDELLSSLEDKDLEYRPGPGLPTLGDLCQSLGENHAAYIDSFVTFEFKPETRRGTAARHTGSVSALQSWFSGLDGELHAVLDSMDDETATTPVWRGPDFQLPAHVHLDVLREALLIFCGKASVYLKLMNKPLPGAWPEWIE
ncbi:MAG: hypothetical protein ACLFM0_04845 [Spirochaetales bacterium]